MQQQSDKLTAFYDLPRRIFLDSSTLQALQDYGEFIYENVEPEPDDRIYKISGGYEELDSLRAICFVGQRAMFEFALSEQSFAEVAAKGDGAYLQWAYEMLAYWRGCLSAYGGNPFDGSGTWLASQLEDARFGYLSTKDRLLLQDALALECDAFLTLDRKLVKNAEHLQREVGLRILLPSQYWNLLSPWARLYA
jgi:hypothetical protein